MNYRISLQLMLGACLTLFSSGVFAKALKEIQVQGNAKVEKDAILNLLTQPLGDEISLRKVQADIKTIYDLGFFSDIRFFTEEFADGVTLTIKVVEKPAITSISIEGMAELKEEDVRDTLETKLFTIVNEGTITNDIRLIEKKYAEKGFYLAKITYTLEEKGKNEVSLSFHVDERGKVLVGDVYVLGNKFFPTSDLFDKFATRPFSRTSAFGSSSLYQAEWVNRDTEFLSFYYRDYGFADVKVAKPITLLDADRNFVRVTFRLEEGIQYHVGSLKVSGDIGEGLFTEKEILEFTKLKEKDLFRYSYFAKDIEQIVAKYGDLGYAYVDVNPEVQNHPETALVDIHYKITKGPRVYFGDIFVIGNTKTRDNVVRRETEVSDSELYSGTKLNNTKENITRLGFFEEVQILKERDAKEKDLVNLKIKVKETSTGQLQAAMGISPGGETSQGVFGQGRYEEKNQSGKGWQTNVTAKWSHTKDFQLDLGFADPKLNDSKWSLGANATYEAQDTHYTGVTIPEKRRSIGITVGRDIIELFRGNITLKHSQIKQQESVYLFEGFRSGGIKNSLITNISRRKLDNYLDPSEGSTLSLDHHFIGGFLGGDYEYMQTELDASHYYPIDFSDTYRTYFKTRGFIGKLWPVVHKTIPYTERYRLGGFYNLRGYEFTTIGPKRRRLQSPISGGYDYNIGGDKEIFFQLEYFVPLIQQAKIKALVFLDAGRVYEEPENLSLSGFSKDVGFGFRWMTPLAPFRFEWAYPYDDQKQTLGDLQFILTFGF